MRTPYTTQIDRPGLYLTRSNKQVRIDSISVSGLSSFPVQGHIYKFDKLGRARHVYAIWTLDGRYRALAGSSLDIVAYVGS